MIPDVTLAEVGGRVPGSERLRIGATCRICTDLKLAVFCFSRAAFTLELAGQTFKRRAWLCPSPPRLPKLSRVRRRARTQGCGPSRSSARKVRKRWVTLTVGGDQRCVFLPVLCHILKVQSCMGNRTTPPATLRMSSLQAKMVTRQALRRSSPLGITVIPVGACIPVWHGGVPVSTEKPSRLLTNLRLNTVGPYSA